MKTSSAKSKGRRCSQEVKALLLKYAPSLKSDDILVTSSGVTGEDLALSPAARDIYPFAIEAKNCEKLNIWKALKQADGHSYIHYTALCFKRNHSKVYIAMELEEFLEYVDEIKRLMAYGDKEDPEGL